MSPKNPFEGGTVSSIQERMPFTLDEAQHIIRQIVKRLSEFVKKYGEEAIDADWEQEVDDAMADLAEEKELAEGRIEEIENFLKKQEEQSMSLRLQGKTEMAEIYDAVGVNIRWMIREKKYAQ